MTELYAIINNCDDTIIKLNKAISNKGFEFIKIEIPELEQKFKFIFGLPEKYSFTGELKYPSGTVSNTFFNAIRSSELIDDWEEGYIIALKTNTGSIELDVNDLFGFKRLDYITKFTNNLIDKLRLFKEGDIEVGCFFSYKPETLNGQLFGFKRSLHKGEITHLSDDEIIEFKNKFLDLEITNPLALKSKMYFDTSFKIQLNEMRFILVITSIESVLSSNKDQISHTFSRHLTLITNKTKEEFNLNYKKIKKLYDYRSKIVHGSTYDEKELYSNCCKIRELARKCILFVNELPFVENKELFEFLNSKGYID
ncbi:MAG: HEPN domain-containing protein [Bacteroidales bacterium]|jgi:hypothetical protein|nr:HEPN domain-containing protein [Bacteroidales bacterium]